jgi:hypothetical protein
MKIDNFEKIKSLLSFESEDFFYFLQILKRHKDNPDEPNLSNSKVIKTYYINNLEYLDLRKEEIIYLCESNNARAYINLNARSYERTAFHMLKEITDRILNKDYKSVSKAYDSACGKYSIGEKKWVVDIDTKTMNSIEWDTLTGTINYLCDPITLTGEDSKIIATIPTKSGYHLITKPFNVSQFKERYPEIDIQKNNPTLCYYKFDH